MTCWSSSEKSAGSAKAKPAATAEKPAAVAEAQGAPAGQKAAQKGLPSIIDRELIFGNPEIINAQVSPDGKYLAFLKPWNDTRNIWVKKTDEPFSAARLLTTEKKRPIPQYLWSRDAKYIIYVKDNDGDGRARVVAEDQSTQLGAIRSSSVQISRKFRQRPEVDHVVLDHQARFGVRDDLLDAIDRGQRIGALEVDRGNAAVLAVVTGVVEIA